MNDLKMMNDLKIIMNVFYPPTDELRAFLESDEWGKTAYVPVNGGSGLTDEWSVKHLAKDNTGVNISQLNPLLNEMTSIFWFWKNRSLPSYVGFAHYRRTFAKEDVSDYQNYDIIVSKPIWSSNTINLMRQYAGYHVAQDLQTCVNVIREFDKDCGDGFEQHLVGSGTNYAPCNMFIMKRELFDEWCGFIFPILLRLKDVICSTEEFKRRDNYQKRALCFLAERIFGYWYCVKKSSGLKTKEVDIVEHLEYKPKGVNERGDFSVSRPKVKSALVAIACNEENYLKEWVDYHLKIGFDDIFVFQNNWRYDRGDITDPRVHFEVIDGPVMQTRCYNEFIRKRHRDYDFMAFFDIDEFMWLRDGEQVDDFLAGYTDVGALYLNWRLFGDSGLKKVENGDYSVLRRFTHCDDKLYRLGKVIINTKKTGCSVAFNNPHILVYAASPMTEFKPTSPSRKRTVNGGNIIDNTNDEPCELYHYRNKTWDELMKRRYNIQDPANGLTRSHTDKDLIFKEFNEHNRNVVENRNLVPFAT